MGTEMYDERFFDGIRDGILSSARALVPILLGQFPDTKSVIDVGCGEGWWVYQFAEYGVEAVGIDGSIEAEAINVLTGPGVQFERHDLAECLPFFHPFDMAISLEVAEHLPPERADSFIDDLCALSDVVVFSAAIPGQGGTGHLNEQWQSWWGKKFFARGFIPDGSLRYRIWSDDRIENWYRQNLIIATRPEDPGSTNRWADWLSMPLDLVHPVLFDARRQR